MLWRQALHEEQEGEEERGDEATGTRLQRDHQAGQNGQSPSAAAAAVPCDKCRVITVDR